MGPQFAYSHEGQARPQGLRPLETHGSGRHLPFMVIAVEPRRRRPDLHGTHEGQSPVFHREQGGKEAKSRLLDYRGDHLDLEVSPIEPKQGTASGACHWPREERAAGRSQTCVGEDPWKTRPAVTSAARPDASPARLPTSRLLLLHDNGCYGGGESRRI